MRVLPVIFDMMPSFLSEDGNSGSLLTLPAGSGSLLGEIAEAVSEVTAHPPMILPLFSPRVDYEARLHAVSQVSARVSSFDVFRDPLAHFEASDALLLIAPQCYPSEGLDLSPLVRVPREAAGMTRHLLAFEATTLRTKEIVHNGGNGRIRRIQRYFAPVTWPFPAGLMATYLPVSALLMSGNLPIESLERLRAALSAQGMASQDIPFHGEFFDLTDESGALTFMERRLLAAVRVDGGDGSDDLEGAQEEALAGLIHPGASVHPTARLMGPVAVGAGALIGPGALIVGPTAIGDRATICSDAVVAQCFVSAGSFIAPGETIRHCVNTYRETDSPRPPQVRFANTVPARPSSEPTTPFGPRHLEVKAMIDATIASVALVVLAPLLVLIAALVKVTSRGPIFYGARREGLHGRPFRCWKFRSMQTDAEVLQKQLAGQQEMDGPQFKMARDPRVTAIGRFLRATNLDELPQLFNVARMQMSIVGPRPSPFGENQICIPWRNARLAVRPGITGLWQICRHDREQGDFHQWIQYDLLYVRNASLFLDFKILVATVLTAGGRHPVAIERIIPSESRPLPAELPKRPHAEPLAPLYRNTPGSVPVVQSTQ